MHCIVAAAVAVLVLVAVVVAVARVVVAVACCCLHLILLHIALLYFFIHFVSSLSQTNCHGSRRVSPPSPSFSSPLSLAYSFSAAADSLLPAPPSSISPFPLLVLCNNYNSKIIDALHKRAANSFLR